MNKKQSLLITGTSSGIGQACAVYFDRLGYKIYAGVRNHNDAENLQQICSNNVFPIIIDVTKPETIKKAFDLISNDNETVLAALINNAGIAVGGPVEILSVEKFKEQFEVNFFGQISIIKTFLPLLKKTKGRIINISSILGSVTFPFNAAYCASKASLNCLTEALGYELKDTGIKCITVRPGVIKTPIWEKSSINAKNLIHAGTDEECGNYSDILSKFSKIAGKIAKKGSEPEEVAKVIHKIIKINNPCKSYYVGRDALMLSFITKLPDGISGVILNKMIDYCISFLNIQKQK
jgi:NAD(P)-dependent dehydrogenase (short-subunit alcohol dehydrogenase family)